MANKRIRRKRAKVSGKAIRYHPKELFRSEISIKSTEVSPYSESKLIQTAQRELAQIGYQFWFKEPIELEDVTRDDIKYLASGKLLKQFQAKIEPVLTVNRNAPTFEKQTRNNAIELANYFYKKRIKTVRGLSRAMNDLERNAQAYEKFLRKTERGRKMLERGTAPAMFTVVRYSEFEII